MTRKRGHTRTPKRHAHNKRKTSTPSTTQQNSEIDNPGTSSSKKIKLTEYQELNSNDLGYGLVDMNIIVSMLKLFPCPECTAKDQLSASVENIGGQALRLIVLCNMCGYDLHQDLSEKVSTPGK